MMNPTLVITTTNAYIWGLSQCETNLINTLQAHTREERSDKPATLYPRINEAIIKATAICQNFVAFLRCARCEKVYAVQIYEPQYPIAIRGNVCAITGEKDASRCAV